MADPSTRRHRTGDHSGTGTDASVDLADTAFFSHFKTSWKSLESCPKELWINFVLKFCESYNYFAISQVLVIFLHEEFGISDIEAGTMYGLWGAAITFWGVTTSWINDNLGVRQSLLIGFFLSFCSTLTIACATSKTLIYVILLVFYPLGTSMGIPMLTVGIRRYTTASNRGFAFGLYYAVMNIGAFVSGPIVDIFNVYIEDGVTPVKGGLHWTPNRLVILTASLVCSCSFFTTYFFLREIRVVEDIDATSDSCSSSIRAQADDDDAGMTPTSTHRLQSDHNDHDYDDYDESNGNSNSNSNNSNNSNSNNSNSSKAYHNSITYSSNSKVIEMTENVRNPLTSKAKYTEKSERNGSGAAYSSISGSDSSYHHPAISSGKEAQFVIEGDDDDGKAGEECIDFSDDPDFGKYGDTNSGNKVRKECTSADCSTPNSSNRLLSTDEVPTTGIKEKEYVPEQRPLREVLKELCSSKTFWRFAVFTLFMINLKAVFRHLDATLPTYLVRSFGDHVPKGMIYSINPFMIIFLTPLVAAYLGRYKHYDMIKYGGYITAIAPFFLAVSTSIWAAIMMVVFLSFGEAIWSPRVYDYTMSIAPEGREATFAALAAAPLFAAKVPVGLMSGYLISKYMPEDGHQNGQMLWFIIGITTLISPILITACERCIREPEKIQRGGADNI